MPTVVNIRPIPELVEYFVQHFAASMEKDIETISEQTMRGLVRHAWPGNIRELQNYIERAVILSSDGVFEPAPLESCEPLEPEITNPTLEEKVRREILTACQRSNWKLGGPRGAAARLGLKRTTLFYKMKRLGIRPPADQWQDSDHAFRVVAVVSARFQSFGQRQPVGASLKS